MAKTLAAAKRHAAAKRRRPPKTLAAAQTLAPANNATAPAVPTGTVLSGSIVVSGLTRTYLIDVPSSLPKGKTVPLLLMFHGSSNTAAGIEAATGFDQIANQDGFIVVYPQGVDNTWNDGRGTSAAALAGVNDVAFVQALVQQIEATYPIDPSRVYAAGFSNGAVFTELLGCELAGTFAAIATVAGPLAAPISGSCFPTRPLSVFEVQGTTDPVMPWGGGTVNSAVGGLVLSEAATVALWAQRDGCSGAPLVSPLPAAPNDGTGVQLAPYSNCSGGAVVDAVSVIGGVHEWPGDLTALAPGAVNPPNSFTVSSAAWSFLSQFTLS